MGISDHRDNYYRLNIFLRTKALNKKDFLTTRKEIAEFLEKSFHDYKLTSSFIIKRLKPDPTDINPVYTIEINSLGVFGQYYVGKIVFEFKIDKNNIEKITKVIFQLLSKVNVERYRSADEILLSLWCDDVLKIHSIFTQLIAYYARP
jgi:hypothetical protein